MRNHDYTYKERCCCLEGQNIIARETLVVTHFERISRHRHDDDLSISCITMYCHHSIENLLL